MIATEIQLWGLKILEPGTVLSDFLMGLACLIFFLKLIQMDNYKTNKFFGFFFLFLSASSFVAGAAHGLFYYFGSYLHIVSWILSGFAIYFIQLGTAVLFENEKFKNRYIRFIRMQLLIYSILLFVVSGFVVVKINFVIAMIGIITPVYLIDLVKKGYRSNLFIMIGIFLAILPSLYHRKEFTFGYIFNMNDLSHFFLILCIFFVFLGVKDRFFKFNPDLDIRESMI